MALETRPCLARYNLTLCLDVSYFATQGPKPRFAHKAKIELIRTSSAAIS